MSTTITESKAKNFRLIIYVLSVAIPVVVAALFKVRIENVDLGFLPPIYAGINGLTALLLIIALAAIKAKNIKVHKLMINCSLGLSLLFLAMYVAYHMTSDPTPYLGEFGYIYYPLLVSHIVLSVAVIPVVLFTYLFAWQGDFVKHKKWTRFAWPVWFYVATTGVIVYFMISPYYT